MIFSARRANGTELPDPSTSIQRTGALRNRRFAPARRVHEVLRRVRERTIIRAMPYDEALAARVRELLAGERQLTEKGMFGGLAFLIGGNMAVAASGQGGLLVRVDPAESAALVAATPARPMEMRGRQMAGWLRIDAKHVSAKRALASWVQRGLAFARSLPPKRR